MCDHAVHTPVCILVIPKRCTFTSPDNMCITGYNSPQQHLLKSAPVKNITFAEPGHHAAWCARMVLANSLSEMVRKRLPFLVRAHSI